AGARLLRERRVQRGDRLAREGRSGVPRVRGRRPADRRFGERDRRRGPAARSRRPPAPDRPRPALRACLRGRRRRPPDLRRGEVVAMHHFPWLTVVTFTPLAGALPLALFPKRALNLHRVWGLFVTVLTFGLSLGILASFKTGALGFQLVDHAVWVRSLNFN